MRCDLRVRGVQKKGEGVAWRSESGVSQGHSGAGVFELAGQHSSVQLVKLYQVDQVGKLGGAVVKAEEHLTVFLTLERRDHS